MRFRRGDQVRSKVTGRYGVVDEYMPRPVGEESTVVRFWTEYDGTVTEAIVNEVGLDLIHTAETATDPTLFRDIRELLAVVERTADLRPVRQRATMLRYRLAAVMPDENDGGGE